MIWSCLLLVSGGSLHGDDARVLDAARVRPHRAARPLVVGPASPPWCWRLRVYATWAAFQGEHYAYGPYAFALLFAELYGRRRTPCSAQAFVVAGVAGLLAGAPDPLGARRFR